MSDQIAFYKSLLTAPFELHAAQFPDERADLTTVDRLSAEERSRPLVSDRVVKFPVPVEREQIDPVDYADAQISQYSLDLLDAANAASDSVEALRVHGRCESLIVLLETVNQIALKRADLMLKEGK